MVIKRGTMKLVEELERKIKRYGNNLTDKCFLIRFMEPADSLVRRISSGNKKGIFMCSDLSNKDIED